MEARMAKTAATKNTITATTRAARAPRAKKNAVTTVAHAEMLEVEGSAGIDALLADLLGDGPTAGEAEIILSAQEPELMLSAPEAPVLPAEPEAPVAAAALSEEDEEAEVMRLLSVEASLSAATVDGSSADAAPPSGEGSDVAPLAAAEGTDEAAEDAAPKRVATPRKHYTNALDRIKDRLGANASEFTVLTLADAEDVSEENLTKVMEDTFSIIGGMNKKEGRRAGFLFDFVTGVKPTLNTVLETTLKVLHRDGHITTGKTSNLMTELLTGSKPYTLGSARAMSGNTVGMFHDLKLLKQDGKGRFIANEESTLLAAANAKLGLVATAAAAV
jgi:hypothetical protein